MDSKMEVKRVVHEPVDIVMSSNNVYEQLEKDKIDTIKRLATECLSSSRADSYQTWIEVGWCLNSIDPSDEMFHVWMDFSNKSGKAGTNNVNALLRDWKRGWGHSREKSFTSRSLHMWANKIILRNTKKL